MRGQTGLKWTLLSPPLAKNFLRARMEWTISFVCMWVCWTWESHLIRFVSNWQMLTIATLLSSIFWKVVLLLHSSQGIHSKLKARKNANLSLESLFYQTPLQSCRPNSTSVGWTRIWLCFPPKRRWKKNGRKEPTTIFYDKKWPYIFRILWLSCWCLKGACKLSGVCLSGVWRVSGGCLEGVWRVSGGCLRSV